jgi:hypothetical protein
MPEEQPLVPSPRARRLIRLVLLLLELIGTPALLAFGYVVLLPRVGPEIWFWAACIVLITIVNLVTLLRDPDYPFSILHRLHQRRRA